MFLGRRSNCFFSSCRPAAVTAVFQFCTGSFISNAEIVTAACRRFKISVQSVKLFLLRAIMRKNVGIRTWELVDDRRILVVSSQLERTAPLCVSIQTYKHACAEIEKLLHGSRSFSSGNDKKDVRGYPTNVLIFVYYVL